MPNLRDVALYGAAIILATAYLTDLTVEETIDEYAEPALRWLVRFGVGGLF